MNEFLNVEATRRGFFARGAMLTAGATAAALMLSKQADADPTDNLGISRATFVLPGSGDVQVLNYALTLEDLEADLYAQALAVLTNGSKTGTKASASVGTLPALNLTSSDPVLRYVAQFAPVEAAHRDYLFAALGGTASGTSAITAITPKKYDFGLQSLTGDTNTIRLAVLNLVLEAEATGVQAYLGAIPYFSTGSKYLPTAAAIQGTEARHTSALTIVRNIISGGTPTPVAPLKGDSGGSTTPSQAASTYVSATPNLGDANGIDLYLTPTQVVTRVAGFIKTS